MCSTLPAGAPPLSARSIASAGSSLSRARHACSGSPPGCEEQSQCAQVPTAITNNPDLEEYLSELPCDVWEENSAAKIAGAVGISCADGNCIQATQDACPTTCHKQGCADTCARPGKMPTACSLDCAVAFLPLYDDCGVLIDHNFDIMDGRYDGRARDFQTFYTTCNAIPQGQLTADITAMKEAGCTVKTDGVRSLNPTEAEGVTVHGGEHIWGTRASVEGSQSCATEAFDTHQVSTSISTMHFVATDQPSTADSGQTPGPTWNGVYFNAINLPKNADIVDAKLVFTVDNSHVGDATSANLNLRIYGQLDAYPKRYHSREYDLSGRDRTRTHVAWKPADCDGSRETLQTPDLTEIVSEIVSMPEWHRGNPMLFLISDSSPAGTTGERWVSTSGSSNGIVTPVLMLTVKSDLSGHRRTQIHYDGGDSCSFSDFDGRIAAINGACCDDMDSDDDCVSGMPESCDIECAIECELRRPRWVWL